MLKVQEIRELIKLVDQSSINEFVYEHEGYKIKMKKNAVEKIVVSEPAAPVAAVAPVQPKAVEQLCQSAAVQEAPKQAPATKQAVAPAAKC